MRKGTAAPMPPRKSAFACLHVDRPLWARGLCKSCYHEWLKQENPEYAKKQHVGKLKWKTTATGRALSRRYEENKRQRDPEYQSRRNLARYGLTVADYESLLTKQGGGCAICEKKPGKRKLHVDHDHETGHVRGLLCFRCNYGISFFSEDASKLERATRYLVRSQDAWREERFGKVAV